MSNDNKPQAELFASALAQLKPNVTATDRKQAEKELSLTRNTISQYLGGAIRDLDTAAALIAFFKKRIEQRNQVLA